jgi:hypothetical protein
LAAIDDTTTRLLSSIAYRIGPSYGCSGGGVPSGKNYYVQVAAEGRDGKILKATKKIKCSVREL